MRITEYETFQRLGSNKTIHRDVRIIGATNIDLPNTADAGDFRHDLLDRLALDVITLPPLRHRHEDILILAFHFGQKITQELGWETFVGFTDTVIEKLMNFRWPGNVRELKNVIERAVYYTENENQPIETVLLDPFNSPYRPESKPLNQKYVHNQNIKARKELDVAPLDYQKTIENYEKVLLNNALKVSKFNQKEAAKLLNLNYHQLRHQLKKHNLLS